MKKFKVDDKVVYKNDLCDTRYYGWRSRMMTKSQARIVIINNYNIITKGCDLGLLGRDRDAYMFEDAVDLLLDSPSIAQSIRDAAVNWPCFLGDVECCILSFFCDWNESIMDYDEWSSALQQSNATYKMQVRMFMLFAAEALE